MFAPLMVTMFAFAVADPGGTCLLILEFGFYLKIYPCYAFIVDPVRCPTGYTVEVETVRFAYPVFNELHEINENVATPEDCFYICQCKSTIAHK